MRTIEDYLVSKAPSTVYYVPDFISESEEQYLIGRVENAPKPKWEQLSHRRLQNWGGALGKKGLIVDADLPDWLKLYSEKICQLPPVSLFPESNRPNHVLVNEYLPGQGIMPHTDGPMYFPVVATVSLGSHVVLDMSKRTRVAVDPMESVPNGENHSLENERIPVGSLLLERRSLVVIKDDMYSNYLHGIAERTADTMTEGIWNLDKCSARKIGDTLERAKRISLTIRNVPKTTRLNIKK